jgi:hypothetical protein
MFMADSMRSGPEFLVGESVRVHYPASGVGMKVCLQDAFNIGWKRAAAVTRDLADLDGRYARASDPLLVGTRLRNVAIRRRHGTSVSLHELLRVSALSCSDFAGRSVPALPPHIAPHVHSVSGRIVGRTEFEGLSALLIRPDGHVAWMCTRPLAECIRIEELSRWF